MFASDPDPVGPLPLPLPAGRRSSPSVRADDPLLAAVGGTPLVPLRTIGRGDGAGFELWGKLEARNPSGSVKDRPALAIVRAALDEGTLGAGRTLVDASSGNTALAYAWLGARCGFGVRLYVPRNANPDRLRAIRELGAELVLSDPAEGTDGAREEARACAAREPGRFFFADQYRNPANPRAHYTGTGPEIWKQTHGRITHLVAGVGTGGTISGTGRFLKEQRPSLQVVGVEPTGPMHGLEGLKHLPTAQVPETYDPGTIDLTVRIETEEAESMVRRLAREEGLRVGRSSGAAVAAAARIGAASEGAFLVAVLPDGGSHEEGDR